MGSAPAMYLGAMAVVAFAVLLTIRDRSREALR